MTQVTASLHWTRDGARFAGGRYSRGHTWRFDGGVEVPASASPRIVPPPLSLPGAVDPEEAFVASLASCHMLWFLSLAARRGLVVDRYRDDPAGELGADVSGRVMMVRVTLRPAVEWSAGTPVGDAELAALHREAHEQCFLARSVRTEVCCHPVAGRPGAP